IYSRHCDLESLFARAGRAAAASQNSHAKEDCPRCHGTDSCGNSLHWTRLQIPTATVSVGFMTEEMSDYGHQLIVAEHRYQPIAEEQRAVRHAEAIADRCVDDDKLPVEAGKFGGGIDPDEGLRGPIEGCALSNLGGLPAGVGRKLCIRRGKLC